MGFFDLFRRKKVEKSDPELEMLKAKIHEFEEKYLADMVEQLNDLTKVDFVALPSFSSSSQFGRKELPLRCAVKEAYNINPIVYSCINAIAQTASTVPFTLQKRIPKNGQYEMVFEHPVLQLLNNPNKTQTQSEFVEHIVHHLMLCR